MRSPSPQPTHVQQQEQLRNETISAFHNAVEEDSDADDGLLTLRDKTQDELEREEEEYRMYLEREVGDVKSLVRVEEDELTVKIDEDDLEAVENDGKKKKKGKMEKKGKGKEVAKKESDQEFLMK